MHSFFLETRNVFHFDRYLFEKLEKGAWWLSCGNVTLIRELRLFEKLQTLIWIKYTLSMTLDSFCFCFGGTLGSASGAEFPVSLSNHAGFKPRLLYSSTCHSPESLTHLKTG